MRERDLELIAALVEGRLEDETEARSLIASSEDARREYEAQVTAYRALRSMGTESLRDSERSALRRDVWTALRSQPATVQRPWSRGWLPAAAAAAAVLVGVVGVLASGLGGQDASLRLDEVAADLEEGTETTAPAAAGDSDAGEGAEMTTLAATGTTAAASNDSGAGAESFGFFAAEARRLRQTGESITSEGSDQQQSPSDLDACLRRAGLADHVPVDTVEPPEEIAEETGSTLLAAVPEDVAREQAPVTFVDTVTCSVVHVED